MMTDAEHLFVSLRMCGWAVGGERRLQEGNSLMSIVVVVVVAVSCAFVYCQMIINSFLLLLLPQNYLYCE